MDKESILRLGLDFIKNIDLVHYHHLQCPLQLAVKNKIHRIPDNQLKYIFSAIILFLFFVL